MRSYTGFLLVLAATVLGASCADPTGSGDDVPRGTPVQVTRFRPQTFEFFSGFTQPVRQVIASEAEWRAAWSTLYQRATPQSAAPPVDFGRETVLLAALGERSSGGYSILVDSVYAAPGETQVVVRKTSPGAGCSVIGAMTQPVDVVRVPRVSGTVTWIEKDEVRDCR